MYIGKFYLIILCFTTQMSENLVLKYCPSIQWTEIKQLLLYATLRQKNLKDSVIHQSINYWYIYFVTMMERKLLKIKEKSPEEFSRVVFLRRSCWGF